MTKESNNHQSSILEHASGHRFASITDVVNDTVFRRFVLEEIYSIRLKYASRPAPPKGHHYKRTWVDRMIDTNQLNPEFFLDNIKSILLKTSNLNSETRTVIQTICTQALGETMNHYSNNPEQPLQ